MNVYHELLELLNPQKEAVPAVCFGSIAEVEPLTVSVGGAAIDRRLFYPRGSVFDEKDIGKTVALLPCQGGFLLLFCVEGGETP